MNSKDQLVARILTKKAGSILAPMELKKKLPATGLRKIVVPNEPTRMTLAATALKKILVPMGWTRKIVVPKELKKLAAKELKKIPGPRE